MCWIGECVHATECVRRSDAVAAVRHIWVVLCGERTFDSGLDVSYSGELTLIEY